MQRVPLCPRTLAARFWALRPTLVVPVEQWHDAHDMLPATSAYPRRMGRLATSAGLAGLLAGAVFGCGPSQTPIPEGAQQVHVEVAGSEVRLDPSTVRAGDIYFVLDTPGSSVGFAQRQRTAQETPGPLTDEDIERLARGDTGGTSIGGFDDAGCSPEQRASSRGRMGPCGNVFQMVLTPGKYVLFTGNLDGGPPGDHSDRIAILHVAP